MQVNQAAPARPSHAAGAGLGPAADLDRRRKGRRGQRDFRPRIRFSARSQVPTAKIRNAVRAVTKTAPDRSGSAPAAAIKKVRLTIRTKETFTRTYNGVG